MKKFLMMLVALSLIACSDDTSTTNNETRLPDAGMDASTPDQDAATTSLPDAGTLPDVSVEHDASMAQPDAASDAGSGPEINEEGYGSTGPYAVVEETFANPGWPEGAAGDALDVHIFRPEGLDASPVVFFSHGYGANQTAFYQTLFEHIASRGLTLVYVPYPTLVPGVADDAGQAARYATLWAGFEEAVRLYGDEMDLTKVGFMGHSFGGGATPALAYEGFVEKGWGSVGAFMFISAPWYSFDLGAEDAALPNAKLAGLPGHTRAVFQLYEADETNDHRMAIDLFDNLSLPAAQVGYHMVEINDDYPADHKAPATGGPEGGVLDAIDTKAIWVIFDALVDATFEVETPEAGAELVFNAERVEPYDRRLADPVPALPQRFYRFPWVGAQNLRD